MTVPGYRMLRYPRPSNIDQEASRGECGESGSARAFSMVLPVNATILLTTGPANLSVYNLLSQIVANRRNATGCDTASVAKRRRGL
jgi:hypothetical protein